MQAKKSKTLFFDVYQTLVDAEIDKDIEKANKAKAWAVLARALEKYGVDVTSDTLLKHIEKEKDFFYAGKDKKIYHHNFARILSSVMSQDFNVELDKSAIDTLLYQFRKTSRGYARLYPSVAETLAELAQSYTLGVASYTQGSYTKLELQELGIEEFFSFFVYTSDVGFHKTSPKFYRHCLSVAGMEAKNCAMIGDNYEDDVLTPRRLGFKTIWIDNPKTDSLHSHLLDTEETNIVKIDKFDALPQAINHVFA